MEWLSKSQILFSFRQCEEVNFEKYFTVLFSIFFLTDIAFHDHALTILNYYHPNIKD